MILFYVRHGDPIYSPDSLTPLGTRQAEAAAKRLALYGIDRIYASTSQRAIDTAQPASELTKKPITQLDFCNEEYVWNEFAFPNREGRKKWAVDNDLVRWSFVSKEVAALGEHWYDHPLYRDYPFKKGMERIHRETDAFLFSLGYEHDREAGLYKVVRPNDERIALFAHEGFGGCFLSSLLDIPYPQFASRFSMGHTGLTVIDFGDTGDYTVPKILTYANDAHLYQERIPKNCSRRTWY